MTRINATIKPSQLCDQHLLAEYRELPRIVTLSKQWKGEKLPQQFCLGTGHVKFFYNKIFFLYKRWNGIRNELLIREYNLNHEIMESIIKSFLSSNWSKNGDYTPTDEAHDLLVARLTERLQSMKRITYYGKPITAEEAINMIKQ